MKTMCLEEQTAVDIISSVEKLKQYRGDYRFLKLALGEESIKDMERKMYIIPIYDKENITEDDIPTGYNVTAKYYETRNHIRRERRWYNWYPPIVWYRLKVWLFGDLFV